jgi:sigma54-dependent transcription regulator
MNKPRIVKDYEKVSEEVLAQIKLEYPWGFQKKLVTFKNKDGKFVSALPFETEDYYYLIRMTANEAMQIIEEDDDYDDDGNLTEEAKERLEDEIEE